MSINPVLISDHADRELSNEAILVRTTLIKRGLETPMIETDLNTRQKYERIKRSMTDVIKTLGLDLSDDSLAETPLGSPKCTFMRFFPDWTTVSFPGCR